MFSEGFLELSAKRDQAHKNVLLLSNAIQASNVRSGDFDQLRFDTLCSVAHALWQQVHTLSDAIMADLLSAK